MDKAGIIILWMLSLFGLFFLLSLFITGLVSFLLDVQFINNGNEIWTYKTFEVDGS